MRVALALLGGLISTLVATLMIPEDSPADCDRKRARAIRQTRALAACFAAPRCETKPADIERVLRSVEAAERACPSPPAPPQPPEKKPEGDLT